MNSNSNQILAQCMKDKRDQSKWLFDCPKCYGKFETRKELTAHQERKLFKCPFKCAQKFTHKYELVGHERICPGRIRNGNFDNYKIYQLIDIRHAVKPRKSGFNDLWVKYPYWN